MFRSLLTFLAGLVISVPSFGQSSLSLYSDQLDNGFQDWSWGTRDFANTSPVYSGTKSIRFGGAFWEAISFHHSDLSTAPYTTLSFRAHGGSTGGQRLQIYAENGGNSQPAYILPVRLPTNAWQLFTIPLSALGISNVADFNRVSLQLRNDGSPGPFYLDEVFLAAKPAPAVVNVSVNCDEVLQTVDERHFGVNLAMWDGYFDPPHHTTTISLLNEVGVRVVRMPGGSLSDQYHWAVNRTLQNTWEWANSFSDMVRVATNIGAQAFITVNYGTGTPEEAAAWVRYANVTNQLGYKYWEIGNENYGTWETDSNSLPNHPYTYATRAATYMAQMRAADPSIKVGVVAVPGEDTYSNGYTDHPALNPRTGQSHLGWTPVMLARLKELGATPDFLVHHHYPDWTDANNPSQSPNNDTALLQGTGIWAEHAADLRQQITDYFGGGGTNIQLVVTENNADAGAQGRQSTSLVNGLYYADSFGQLLRTEFRAFVWWDFRNGTDTGGFFGDRVYGWRTFGDLGMVNGLSTRLPAFYAAKLMQWFARPGDQVLNATSDYADLSAYSARRANGAIALLIVNKSLATNLNAAISLNGFVPGSFAQLRSYGIPQDEAARTNAPLMAQDIALGSITNAGANFSFNFPKMSLTLFTLQPTNPALNVLSVTGNPGLVLQIQGQPNVPYVLQASTNLLQWSSVATNQSANGAFTFTNSITEPAQFWRAVWQE